MFCVDCLEDALRHHGTPEIFNSDQGSQFTSAAFLKYGPPEIMNTDQGSQFTSSAFIRVLEQNNIQISMDGKGCWRDNVFVERLWKSVKYEEVYLHGYDTVSIARQALSRYFDFYAPKEVPLYVVF